MDTPQPYPTGALDPRSSLGHFGEIAATAASLRWQSNGPCPRIALRVNPRHVPGLAEWGGTSRSEVSVPKPQTLAPIQIEFASECVRLQRPPADTLVMLGTKAALCVCSKTRR